MVRFFEEYDAAQKHSRRRLYVVPDMSLQTPEGRICCFDNDDTWDRHFSDELYTSSVMLRFLAQNCRERTETEARTTYPALFEEVDALQHALDHGGVWFLLYLLRKGRKQ